MARKKLDIDFTKIVKTTAGGALVSVGEDLISKQMPAINNNPMVQKLLPAGIGLAIDLLLPNQSELANGAYGASGYKLAKHFMPQSINGTPNAINGTPNAINGTLERLEQMQAKARMLKDAPVENYAEKKRNKNLGYK